jgi:hypothetical protein
MQTVDEKLQDVKVKLQERIPGARLEFSTQVFARHVELWVKVGDQSDYERMRSVCLELDHELAIERNPEIWVVPRSWSAPLNVKQYEQELIRRRDEFRRTHSIRQPSRT